MRYKDDDDAKRLNAQPWQLALLARNPEYCSWGPHEDYMWTKGEGWNSPQIVETWADFDWNLNELNECVNFYFEVNRANKDCPKCKGNGYHPLAQVVQGTFYRHMCEEQGMPESAAWHDKITQDECDALIEAGRVKAGMTAEQVNVEQNTRGRGFFGHDVINRMILIETRLKRLGLPKTCPDCDGHGYVFTEPDAHVSLVLWWLHPRKGCSRGIEITRLHETDLPFVFEFLQSAAKRNADRFKGIMGNPVLSIDRLRNPPTEGMPQTAYCDGKDSPQ